MLAPIVSLEQVNAEWKRIVRDLGRRRRILETILAAARPIRMFDRTLIVGFPPQHRFHQELLDSPEYRGLVERELSETFRQPLEVTTALTRELSGPRRRR